MKTQTSIFNGYPYGEPKSFMILPVSLRPTGQQIAAAAKDDSMIPMNILELYSRALHEAEAQVKDIQIDYPFLPEDYGFKQVHEFKSEYVSHDDNVTLIRVSDEVWQLKAKTRKIIMSEGGDPVVDESFNFHNIINASTEREMYLLFQALGIVDSIKLMVEVEHEAFIGDPFEVSLSNFPVESIKALKKIRDFATVFGAEKQKVDKWYKNIITKIKQLISKI